ncbi:FAD-dependent monooxygenase [Bacillus massiliigorillae]|uniref:FAD-dependent monooxygenase n=1 Tax=Bacillus massiliigorillae TaxID=1243664 RepID=UPI0003A7442C|nr:FAD-dependent monooxygenase [Bacillus massiliigorillae]
MPGHIAILGGGIGGLSAAIALQKTGYDVTIYEKHHDLIEVGAGIILGANALTSLDFLDVGDDIRKIGYAENICTIRSDRGKKLTELTYDGSQTTNYTFLLRSELTHILASSLKPNTIVFNKKLKDFKQHEDSITLYFEDGTISTASHLIASDGIFSTVRQKLLPDKQLRFAGYTCWRGIAENCPNYIEKRFTETWGPKGRIGIVPLSNNRMYWYALKNCLADDLEFKQWKSSDLFYNFINYHDPIPTILERTSDEFINHRDIYDLEPIYQFAFNRILLLGDAAHATTPNMGQGAGQAIEDALFLALCLKDASDITQAFKNYEEQRLERTRKVVKDSWMFGKVAQIDTPLLCSIRNKVIEIAPNKVHHKKIKELFDITKTLKV